MNRIVRGIIVSVSAVLVASCSNSEAGTPSAGSKATPTTESEGAPPSELSESEVPSSDGDSRLGDIEPCELLSALEVSELAVAAGEDDDFDSYQGCSWTKSGDFGFTITLVPDMGVGDLNLDGYRLTPVDIGEHEAQQGVLEADVEGECSVLVVISESSSVSIEATASGGKDTQKACGVGVRVAKIIDPKLP